ncbi:MAG: prepilin-type N-terminal cleavage/methylation domain-containing protein [Planctomycetota bacterium]
MSGEKGFTLLEIVIALSIFAVGLLAVATMQISAIRGNRVGNEYSRATALAQMQIESLKSADFDSAALAAGNYADANNPINETGAAGGIFTRTWAIANNTTFSRRATVTVGWSIAGANRSVVMSTLTRGGGN